MRLRRSTLRRHRSRPKFQPTCRAFGRRGNMTSWCANVSAQSQRRDNPNSSREPVPPERLQTIASDEADEAPHDKNRHYEGHHEADRNIDSGVEIQDRTIFPKIEYGRAEHRWHGKVEGKERAGLAVDADQLATKDRGA